MRKIFLQFKNLTQLKNQALPGFTLLELMVSTALFVVVAVGGLSVVLSSNRAYKNISQNRVAVDNVHMVMDTITREMKYSTDYGCVEISDDKPSFNMSNDYNSFNASQLGGDEDCSIVAFTPEGTTTLKKIYYFDLASSSINQITFTKTGSTYTSNHDDIALTSNNFEVNKFWANVSDINNTDDIQPRADFHVSGIVDLSRNQSGVVVSTTTLFLQASVVERLLDN